MDYSWVLTRSAVERLRRLRAAQRQDMLSFFDELAREFGRFSQVSFTGKDGRLYEMMPWRKYAVTFTVDHPAKTVVIVSID